MGDPVCQGSCLCWFVRGKLTAPNAPNNACQRQALSHGSSLDRGDAAGLHWLDVDNLSPDLPLQQAFV
jgi:hypothetical protein